VRIARISTALVITILSAIVLSDGLALAWFSLVTRETLAADVRANNARAYGDVPGLQYLAKELALSTMPDWNDESDVRKRRDDEADLLSVRPLSARFWLMLSEMRLLTKDSPKRAFDAYELSFLTGSREGHLMLPRGLYAIAHWKQLSKELQMRAANDIVGISNPLTDDSKDAIRRVLAKRSDAERQDIKQALEIKGFAPKDLAALGL
jgi:hypothetical protein